MWQTNSVTKFLLVKFGSTAWLHLAWRQIWRVTGRESGSPELLESPRTSPEVSRTSPEVFGDFPGSSLTVELNSNPEVPRKFPRLPRKFPRLPRKFPGLPWRSAVSLTPSSGSQKLSLTCLKTARIFMCGALNSGTKRTHKAKNRTNSTKEFSEQFEGLPGHYPVKRGF